MRFSSLFSSASTVALLALALGVNASDVIDLTPDTFDDTVKPESLILVEFFAPWCGHCKALAPHYEEAATALKEHGIKLAKVNCVDEADLCQKEEIRGYPTLRVYRDGEFSEYSGPRKADGIIAYMSLPAVSTVTARNFTDFKQGDKVVAMAFLSSENDEIASEFSTTANKHRDDYLFGLTTDKQVIEEAGVTPPAVVVYRSFDEPETAYPYPISSLTSKDLESWLKDLSIPTIDEVSAENYQIYASSGKPLAYLFVDPSDEKLHEHLDILKPVASKYKNKVNFVWIDAIKFGDHAKALNLNEPKWPGFVIQDLSNQLKYPYDQGLELKTASLDEMLELFVTNNLKPTLKSQPIPEVQDTNVYSLVGKQFDEVVFDDSKDVFVEFYASWCGHCKRLAPTWQSLGDHFAKAKDRITIVKMEATENDLPPSVDFRIAGFPTLKFKKAGTRTFIDYDGDRSLESLIAFAEENAKNSLEPREPEAQPAKTPEAEAQKEVHIDHHDEL
ncbi:protein disulfide isomerase [Abortiporus biennis]|nr:protein disulfide isomerase [Abortiporus biennis]